MLDIPTSRDSNGENNMNNRGFDNSVEGVKKVNTLCLLKALSQKSGLVAIKGVIRVVLDRKYPLAMNNGLSRMGGTKSHVLFLSSASYYLSIANF